MMKTNRRKFDVGITGSSFRASLAASTAWHANIDREH
jgi:hypothetical protein